MNKKGLLFGFIWEIDNRWASKAKLGSLIENIKTWSIGRVFQHVQKAKGDEIIFVSRKKK
jgi:hypothetical protein